MALDYARKALDTIAGANYERKDLSPVITMQDGPERPLLRALGDGVPAKGKTHYWDEVALVKPGHGAATYAEGSKPNGDTNAVVQLSNVVCRLGKVAQVTDTMAAVWTGAGSYRLADGELERLYQEAIDYQTALKMEDVLNEMEWMLLNGNSANAEGWAGGQCNGVTQSITTNVIAAGTTSTPFVVGKANAANFEAQIQTLAQQIRALYTPTVPDQLFVTSGQKAGINAFIGGGAGRPLVQIIQGGDNKGFVGGQEVDQYQTGFFKVQVKIEPQLEIDALSGKQTPPTTANLVMLDSRHFKRADLIKLGAEPLARIQTTVERMISTEFTLETRNQKSSGMLTGLAA